ncbi:MAG: PilZ domain-containing protein [bacterium]|nr:PilZ domain-containing protein [bacterium]
MITDRRKYQRFNVDLPVLCKKRVYFISYDGEKGRAKNISSGGALVFTKENIPALTSLKLIIHLIYLKKEIKAVAQVVKSEPIWSGYKLNLKFIKISEKDKKILSKDYLVKRPSKILDSNE